MGADSPPLGAVGGIYHFVRYAVCIGSALSSPLPVGGLATGARNAKLTLTCSLVRDGRPARIYEQVHRVGVRARRLVWEAGDDV